MNQEYTLIKAPRLIDVQTSEVIKDAAVLFKETKIVSAGPAVSLNLPTEANIKTLEYPNKTIMPGLIDCHVHLISLGDGRAGDDLNLLPDEILTLQAAKNAKLHLQSGVTTVRDCGAKNQTTFMLRKSAEMGITDTPRLILTGRPIAIIGGHLSYFGSPATGETECRAAVRQLMKEGADFIKVTATGGSTKTSFRYHASFTKEELTAITDEVHKFDKHVVAHCASSEGIENALDAKVDTIVHCMHFERDGTFKYNKELTKRIVDQGVYVNPTLHAIRHQVWHLENLKETTGLSEQELLDYKRLKNDYETHAELVSRMKDEGVTLVAGSDSAWLNYKMGEFTHELEAMKSIGMSEIDVIRSATIQSAESCAVDDQTGSIEKNKSADIIIVDGNPAEDISSLWNIEEVFKNGEAVTTNK